MDEQIKQQIEEEALRRFPVEQKFSGIGRDRKEMIFDVNRKDRLIFINTCEWYHNNIKESENIEMEKDINIVLPSSTIACRYNVQVKSMVGEILFEHTFYGNSKPLIKESVNNDIIEALHTMWDVFNLKYERKKEDEVVYEKEKIYILNHVEKLLKDITASNQENNDKDYTKLFKEKYSKEPIEGSVYPNLKSPEAIFLEHNWHCLNKENSDLKQAIFTSASKAITKSLNQENNDGWISVEDRLPEKEGYYLGYTRDDYYRQAKFRGGVFHSDDYDGQITHWMTLPNTPKEKYL